MTRYLVDEVWCVVDRNAWYRYHVRGLILDGDRAPKSFSWSVPNVDDERYDLSMVGDWRGARP